MVDITVALTANNESILMGPTIRSAEAAITAVEAAGYTVERLIGLDRSNQLTREFVEQDGMQSWRINVYDHGDQGTVRNSLVQEASGRFVAFLDADDLFSENWLIGGACLLATAQQQKRRVIVHPEINCIFENSTNILVKIPQDDPCFVPEYFYFGNYYDALCIAPREAYIQTPYPLRDIKASYAYEDMQWNIETMAKGWIHVVARDTIIFKRRRLMSQTIIAYNSKSVIRPLDAMRIDRIRYLTNHTLDEA